MTMASEIGKVRSEYDPLDNERESFGDEPTEEQRADAEDDFKRARSQSLAHGDSGLCVWTRDVKR